MQLSWNSSSRECVKKSGSDFNEKIPNPWVVCVCFSSPSAACMCDVGVGQAGAGVYFTVYSPFIPFAVFLPPI